LVEATLALVIPLTISQDEAVVLKPPPNDFGRHLPMAVGVEGVDFSSAAVFASDLPGPDIPNKGVASSQKPSVPVV